MTFHCLSLMIIIKGNDYIILVKAILKSFSCCIGWHIIFSSSFSSLAPLLNLMKNLKMTTRKMMRRKMKRRSCWTKMRMTSRQSRTRSRCWSLTCPRSWRVQGQGHHMYQSLHRFASYRHFFSYVICHEINNKIMTKCIIKMKKEIKRSYGFLHTSTLQYILYSGQVHWQHKAGCMLVLLCHNDFTKRINSSQNNLCSGQWELTAVKSNVN